MPHIIGGNCFNMEMIEKDINEQLNNEIEASESNRVEDFKIKSTKRFFATLSAYIDKECYLKQNQKNNEELWKRYCNKATSQLQSDLKRLGLEYRFVSEFLEGKIPSKDELISKLYIAIGQFAKRQETWFRRMEKQGVKINWLPFDGTEAARTVEWRKQKSIELIFNHNER